MNADTGAALPRPIHRNAQRGHVIWRGWPTDELTACYLQLAYDVAHLDDPGQSEHRQARAGRKDRRHHASVTGGGSTCPTRTPS